jgi:tape measure domain-containing protein
MADPKIKYDIEAAVSGSAEIAALARELDALEKSIDPAGVQRAKALRTEIEALGKQQSAVTAFIGLKNAVIESKAVYEAAQVSAQKLGREIATAGTATRAQNGAFEKAKDTVRAANAAYTDNVVAMQNARSAANAVKISTTELSSAQIQLTAGTKAAASSLYELKSRFNAVDDSAKSTSANLSKVASDGANLSGVFGKLGGVLATAFTGRELVSTIVNMDSLDRGFKAIFGSSEVAAKEMAFLKKTSNEMGLEVQSAGKAYLSLAASTKGSSLEGEKTQKVFASVSRAMSVLGKSTDETQNAFRAISQMANKGTVSMEEWRGQLADALPGAMKATADAAGVTVGQLNAMIANGDVLTKDLLPALADGLDRVYGKGGPPDTLISNWNRLKNRITEVSIELGESGLTKALTDAAIVGANTVGVLGKGFVGLGKGIGDVAGAVATLNFRQFGEDYQLVGKVGNEAISGIADAMGNVATAEQPVIELTAQMESEFTATAQAAKAMGNTAQEAFKKSELAANNTASLLAQKQLYTDLELASTRRIELTTKAVAAAKSEVDAINLIASSFGNEIDKMQAAQLASDLLLDAQSALTNAKKVDLIVAEDKLALLQNEIKGMKELTPELKTQKEALEQAVSVKKEDVRSNEAHTESLKITALAAKTSAEAFKDNAAKVFEYRAALVQATAEVDRLIALESRGLATKKQVSDAQRAQAAAMLLYRDALKDATEAAERNQQAVIQKAATQQKESDLNVESAKTTLELAKARGDDTAIAKAQIVVTNEEVGAKRAVAQALRDEAIAMRATAEAKKSEYEAAGTFTAAKKAEIDAIIESAKQKDIDAKKSDLLANREAELARAVANSAQTYVNALEKKVSAQEKLNSLLEREEALENKRLGRDKDKFSVNSNGDRITAISLSPEGAFNEAKKSGLSEKSALEIYKKYAAIGNANDSRFSDFEALYKEINRLKILEAQQNQQNQQNSATNSSGSAATTNPASPAGSSGGVTTTNPVKQNNSSSVVREAGGRTVNIQIGGGSYPVQTNAQGADNLIKALQIGARNAGF